MFASLLLLVPLAIGAGPSVEDVPGLGPLADRVVNLHFQIPDRGIVVLVREGAGVEEIRSALGAQDWLTVEPVPPQGDFTRDVIWAFERAGDLCGLFLDPVETGDPLRWWLTELGDCEPPLPGIPPAGLPVSGGSPEGVPAVGILPPDPGFVPPSAGPGAVPAIPATSHVRRRPDPTIREFRRQAGVQIAGGGLLGGTYGFRVKDHLLMEGSVSFRPGVRDLVWYGALMLSGTAAWEFDRGRWRPGLFVGLGATPPLGSYFDSYLAAGYHQRRFSKKSDRFALELQGGVGVQPWGHISDDDLDARFMIYQECSFLWRLGGDR